jgi:hypothetical protein
VIVEGLPAITIDDDPREFSALLDHMLPPSPKNIALRPRPISSVFSLLRMARKYLVDDLEKLALGELGTRLVLKVEQVSARGREYEHHVDLVNLINNLRGAIYPNTSLSPFTASPLTLGPRTGTKRRFNSLLMII